MNALTEKFVFALAEVSFGVSVVLIAVFALLPLIHKKFRAKWCYWFWLIIALRLIIPFNIHLDNAPIRLYREEAKSSLSMPLYEEEQGFEHKNSGDSLEQIPAVEESRAEPSAASPQTPPQKAEQSRAVVKIDKTAAIKVVAVIWALGTAICLGTQLWSYKKFLDFVRRWAIPAKKERTVAIFQSCLKESRAGMRLSLAVCPGVESPMVTGFFQTVLLLPTEDYSEEQLAMIIRHELVHYKRKDIAYKMLLMLATAVHWFNPLVWIMQNQANKDLELACDEAATAGMDGTQLAEYGKTLLSVAARKNFRPAAFTTCFYEREGTMKKRIKGLFAGKKRRGTLALLLAFVLALAACTLVACSKKETEQPQTHIETLDGTDYDLTDINEAIGYAVNKSEKSDAQYSVCAFKILYVNEDESMAEAYVYKKCCGFCYINDALTLSSDGEGFAKLNFKKTASGESSVYTVDAISEISESELPPEAKAAVTPGVAEELLREIEQNARAYDKGRSTAILFEMPELKNLPISDTAAALLRQANPEYPDWIGSIERALDGEEIRFETIWTEKSKGCGTVEFIKTDEAKNELSHIIYSVNGDKVELISQKSDTKNGESSPSSAENTSKPQQSDSGTYKYTLCTNEANTVLKSENIKAKTEKAYADWKSYMESYFVSGMNITSFSAWQPNDLKKPVELTKNDVKSIIGLLASVNISPNTPPNDPNPPTGGGWQISWTDSSGEQYYASYNGRYVYFITSADGGKTSIYTESDDGGIGNYLWALEFSKTHNAAAVLKESSFYRREKITAIYAVDGENAAFVQVADSDFVLAAAWLKNTVMQKSWHDETEKSFLIVTENDKYTVWLEETAPEYVFDLWQNTVKSGTKLARWLAYMSPAKVESIVYVGSIYPENEDGFKNASWYSAKAVAEYGEDTVSAEVLKVAEYLQKNTAVKKTVSTTDGFTEDGMRWEMTLKFTTGVSYNLKYCGKSLEVYTSDLDRTIYYEVDTSFGKGVAKLIYSLKTSELNPYMG